MSYEDKDALLYLADVRIDELDAENAKLRHDLEEANNQAEEVCIENAKLRELVGERQRDAVEVVRCRDCEHGHITINGKSCKWCDLIATHDIDGNEPNNGYDPEPYFDVDFFCAWGKRKESE